MDVGRRQWIRRCRKLVALLGSAEQKNLFGWIESLCNFCAFNFSGLSFTFVSPLTESLFLSFAEVMYHTIPEGLRRFLSTLISFLKTSLACYICLLLVSYMTTPHHTTMVRYYTVQYHGGPPLISTNFHVTLNICLARMSTSFRLCYFVWVQPLFTLLSSGCLQIFVVEFIMVHLQW